MLVGENAKLDYTLVIYNHDYDSPSKFKNWQIFQMSLI